MKIMIIQLRNTCSLLYYKNNDMGKIEITLLYSENYVMSKIHFTLHKEQVRRGKSESMKKRTKDLH